jgi:hypothetical protein
MYAVARTTLVLAILALAGTTTAVALGGSVQVAAFTATGDNCFGTVEPFKYQNEGAEYWIPIGDWGMDQRGVLRFDVRSLGGKPDLEVSSIVLKLFSTGFDICPSSLDNVAPLLPEVHAIAAANRDWVAGPGNGYHFVPWTSTTFAKVIGAAPGVVSVPWAGSEGLGTPDVDYNSTVLAARTLVASNVGTLGQEIDFTFSGSSAQLTGLINSWLADNYTLSRDNPGLLIFDDHAAHGSSRRFGFFSRECDSPPAEYGIPGYSASYRPQLVVTYSQAPEPGSLVLLATALIPGLACAWQRRNGSIA